MSFGNTSGNSHITGRSIIVLSIPPLKDANIMNTWEISLKDILTRLTIMKLDSVLSSDSRNNTASKTPTLFQSMAHLTNPPHMKHLRETKASPPLVSIPLLLAITPRIFVQDMTPKLLKILIQIKHAGFE